MSALIEAVGLTRTFEVSAGMFRAKRLLHAVNGIDLAVERGDVLGIVGESGCGKSTLARMLLGLVPPTHGAVRIDGIALERMDRRERARRVQPVFQDLHLLLHILM